MIQLNVIHNKENKERHKTFFHEMSRQSLVPLIRFWPAIYCDSPKTGISKAHKQIVRHAKFTNMETVWIVEDDIKIKRRTGLERFINDIPESFDIYLGGASSLDGNKFTGLHCYILHRKAYDKFLEANEDNNLDYELSKMNLDVHFKSVAIQYDGYSENTGKIENYSRFWV